MKTTCFDFSYRPLSENIRKRLPIAIYWMLCRTPKDRKDQKLEWETIILLILLTDDDVWNIETCSKNWKRCCVFKDDFVDVNTHSAEDEKFCFQYLLEIFYREQTLRFLRLFAFFFVFVCMLLAGVCFRSHIYYDWWETNFFRRLFGCWWITTIYLICLVCGIQI